MATNSSRLNLTRDQLASFLIDHQQIKQFEMLFSAVDAIAPNVVLEINIAVGTAQATANNAIDQIIALGQSMAVNDAAMSAKVQQALDAIPRLAQALELLAAAPVAQAQMPLSDDLTPRIEAPAFPDDLSPVAIPYVAPTAAENAAVLAATITAATSKTTPVDADELPIIDSAASYVLKKLTWANLKATLATWLDAGLIPATLTKLKLTPGYASGTAGVVASDTPIRLFISGNNAYGIGPNAAGGMDIMANQASQAVRVYAGTDNAAPTLAATISGTKTSAPALQVTGVAGYLSSDGSAGYTGTVTTASLVGQTITIKDGIITNFA